MGSFDGVRICELVGFLALYDIGIVIDPGYHSLYYGNSQIILNYSNSRMGDIKCKKKNLQWLFKKFGFE